MVRFLAGFICVLGAASIYPAANEPEKDDPHKIPADAKAILEKADSFELYSLDFPRKAEDENPKDAFGGFKILGKTTIAKAEVRKLLVDALEKGVDEYKGDGAKCFNPRHGILVKHEGKVAYFVICFECSQVSVTVGKRSAGFLVSKSPADVFNKVLKDAGLPLAR